MSLYRKIRLEKRNRIENREAKDVIIMQNFFAELSPEVKRVFIYASYGSEVDTKGLIDALIERNIEVFCPKVYDIGMEFFPINDFSELEPGYSNLPEPVVFLEEAEGKTLSEVAREHSFHPENVPEDICVIPGLAFDEEGARMGYGKAYYDRYLAEFPCYKLALAYEDQVEQVPLIRKDHDIMMDKLITEEKVREWHW